MSERVSPGVNPSPATVNLGSTVNGNKKTPKEWMEISIDIDPPAEEALCEFLFQMGCTGIVNGDFQSTPLKAYFPFEEDFEENLQRLDHFIADLKNIFPDMASPAIRFQKVENKDWSTGWKQFFKPEHVTPHLLILPAWEPIPGSPGNRVLRIDPGPAFGTGKHPTTRMCLEAMEMVTLNGPWSMLDVGTGSGILAIYGACLGAEKVTAIDKDREALRWAERNIKLNEVTQKIELSSVPINRLTGEFSLLTANLIFSEIIKIINHLGRLTGPMGWLIISGILADQKTEIDSALNRLGFLSTDHLRMEEWVCILTRKEKVP